MTGTIDPTVINLTVFVLAVFVGYHVVWSVTPALHTPLMSVTNAIFGRDHRRRHSRRRSGSSATGLSSGRLLATALAAVNIFGGFLVTQRMLEMFKKKDGRNRQGTGGRMTANQVALWYLVASVLFILALKGLSSPATARRGNLFGIIGMAIAVLTTLAIVTSVRVDHASAPSHRRRRRLQSSPSACR